MNERKNEKNTSRERKCSSTCLRFFFLIGQQDKLKRVHLELGGKSPVIVFGDADLDQVAGGIHVGGYINAGQTCSAASRVLAHESVYDALVEKLVAMAKAVTIARSPDTPGLYGPLNSAKQLQAVTGFFDRLPAHAKVLTGGKRLDGKGYFFEPTVVVDLQQSDEMIQSEVFGPVITVQKFSTEAEAIEMANDVDYGLCSSVWTMNHGTAMRVSRALDCGSVWINTHLPTVAEMPHGGFHNSGYGKDLSTYSLEDYTRVKHVMTSLG